MEYEVPTQVRDRIYRADVSHFGHDMVVEDNISEIKRIVEKYAKSESEAEQLSNDLVDMIKAVR